MKKVRIDVPNLLYAGGITLTILVASHILPVDWSSLFDYWILACTYGIVSTITTGVIDEVKRENDK
ncbi:hypothetical protein [Lacticaseibacillus sp. 866-1]|uniref:hypothetical protein n=1 Tax=Lacticaseibacillus sp. 866-1 TaxID=2799576 RepID=UPI00194293D0|nr:hypothetical protein [Lacticaseibacillus sp. 866-1]